MAEKEIKKTPVLDNFSIDLIKLAKEGKLDPVIGRDKEIKRFGQILSRRRKNNILIIGLEGTGKTILVHGLVQKIAKQDCSPLLHNKRIVELDISALVAGTKYRGQFEERLKSIMKEVEDNPDIVLFIDEVHTLIGAGAASGAGDASNMIKPALSSGKMQLIGSTTLDEYQKTIEKDRPLNRRFQKVIIIPPTIDETIEILKKIKYQYEEHHSVTYSTEIIENIVKLSDRYLSNLQFPDKAIDVMDEVGSYVRGETMTVKIPSEISMLETNLTNLRNEKALVLKQQNYEAAALFRDKERQLLEDLKTLKEGWLKKIKQDVINITENDVANIISAMSNVPINKLSADENIDLLNLENVINNYVIGQPNAVYLTVKELQKARIGIKDPNSVNVLLYVGGSGLGKTLLAKAVAKFHFNDPDALIRINLNEYSDKISVSRLIGASPGYIGYQEGGELTNKVKSKPYSVILLDEFEKGHPDLWDIFLQVWDEGILTDAQGSKVDFRNTFFILTSNIGTSKLNQFGRGIGYNKNSIMDRHEIESLIIKEVEKTIKPELLNRIDDIIVFDNLDNDALYKIIEINIDELRKRLTKHFEFNITDKVKDFLIKDGYNEKFGARPLKRSITKLIENTLVDVILKGIEPGSEVNADIVNNKIDYQIKKKN